MSIAGRFAAHFHRLQDLRGDDPELLSDRLAAAAAQAIGAAGTGLSIFVDGLRLPVGASNDQAVLAERLQFTTGEGPCLHVMHTGTATHADSTQLANQWPEFHRTLTARTTFRAVIAVPVYRSPGSSGPPPGCMDVFFDRDDDLTDAASAAARTVAGVITGMLAVSTANDGPSWFQGPPTLPRRSTIIAVGLISAEAHLSAAEALHVLRSHARRAGHTIDDIAHAIATRRLTLADVLDSPTP